jgi:hypothetical protein
MTPREVAGRRPRALVPLGARTRTEAILGYASNLEDVTEVREGDKRYWVIGAGDANLVHVPPGAETAQQTFDHLLRTGVAPVLRGLGLKGSGRRFHWDRGQSRLGWVSFKRWWPYSRSIFEFTINLAVARTLTEPGYWSERIGSYLPEVEDTWWSVPVGAVTDDLLADLVGSLRDHGLVALEAAMDEAEHPPDPPRPMRPRPPLPSVDQMFPLAYVPASLEAAFEDMASDDLRVRSTALRAAYQHAPEDPRLVPVLTSMIRDDASPARRATATTMLGFVSCEPGVSLSVFHRVLDEDESLGVRIAARHAIRTVERRYEGS